MRKKLVSLVFSVRGIRDLLDCPVLFPVVEELLPLSTRFFSPAFAFLFSEHSFMSLGSRLHGSGQEGDRVLVYCVPPVPPSYLSGYPFSSNSTITTPMLMAIDLDLSRRIIRPNLPRHAVRFVNRHPIRPRLDAVDEIFHLLRIETQHPNNLIALLNGTLIPPYRVFHLRSITQLDAVVARLAFIRTASLRQRLSKILPLHRRARQVPPSREAGLPQRHHPAAGLGVREDRAVEFDVDAPVGGEDVNAMEGVFRVVDDLGLLLEPLVQGFEIELDESRELGVERGGDDERVDSFVTHGELRGGGLDSGDRGRACEGGGGGECGFGDPVLREPFVFPDEEAGGCVEDDGAGEDAADALLHWDDLWSVFRFGVEELSGEFCYSGGKLVDLSVENERLMGRQTALT
jgi:hypothetical protein